MNRRRTNSSSDALPWWLDVSGEGGSERAWAWRTLRGDFGPSSSNINMKVRAKADKGGHTAPHAKRKLVAE